MSKLLKKPSPATVIACLALFVASTGTGVAAGHYLITSTKQIKPSVLKQLKGVKGPRGQSVTGLTGPQGPAGPTGATGATGAQGPAGTARAYAQVVTNDPANPYYDQNSGFPAGPRHIATGKLCIPAPAGVDADNVPAFVSLSGTSVGYVTLDSSNADCRSGEFEVWTANLSNVFADHILFNIMVP
jgi:hypothetical protein